MRILIFWDSPAEAELITLYLRAAEHETLVADSFSSMVAHASATVPWDAFLLATGHPNPDDSLELLRQLHQIAPDIPVLGACRTDQIYQLARYLTHGLRSYVLRDVGGDFVFLLQATIESTVLATRAEREQQLAARMRDEIESVRKFQESIISRDLVVPDGYRVAACYEPSQLRIVGGVPVHLAGGDYYEVAPIDCRHTLLMVGDATGHGMRACMSIMTLHTLINMIAVRSYRRTASFVKEINQHFCRQSICRKEGSLITLFYSVLNSRKHEVRWTSAGHPLPLLQRLDTGTIEPLAKGDIETAPPLGVDDSAEYFSFSTSIPPRSRLLIFSDGMSEAHPGDSPSRQYGVKGIMETLMRTAAATPQETLDALLADSHLSTGGDGRHDDTSAILLERL